MKITRYHVPAEVNEYVKIAFVSDLHDRNPEETLNALREQEPDLILVGGDLMERHEYHESEWTVEKMDEWQGIPPFLRWFTRVLKKMDGSLPMKNAKGGKNVEQVVKPRRWNTANGHRFLKEAIQIAPVCLSMGNHEWYYRQEDYDLFESLGVNLLDNADTCLMIKGNQILIGGLSTRYDMEWLESFSGKEGLKILLAHHPDYYIRKIRGTKLDTFHLILSGHTHGGQWRLFSSKGERRGISVYSPGQGFFPRYVYGRYDRLIVGSGVSNTSKIPRFGNPCELVIVDLSVER